MQREGEENEECSQSESKIKPRRGKEVEAPPPAKVALFDPKLEDKAHNAPGEVVKRRGWRYGAGTAEYEGRHEVSGWRFGPPLDVVIDQDRYDGADDEEEEKTRVDLSGGKHTRGPNEPPNDRGLGFCQS